MARWRLPRAPPRTCRRPSSASSLSRSASPPTTWRAWARAEWEPSASRSRGWRSIRRRSRRTTTGRGSIRWSRPRPVSGSSSSRTVYTVPRVGLGARGLRRARRRPLLDHPAEHAAWARGLARLPGRRGPPLRAGRALLDAPPRPPAPPDHAPGRSGTRRTSPGSSSRARTSIATRPCCRRPRRRSGGQDPTARILLGGLFRYPLAGRKGGDPRHRLPAGALRPPRHRRGVRRGRDPPLRRPPALRRPGRSSAWSASCARPATRRRGSGSPRSAGRRAASATPSTAARAARRGGSTGAFDYFARQPQALGNQDGPLVRVARRPAGGQQLQVVRPLGPLPRRRARAEARLGRLRSVHRRPLTAAGRASRPRRSSTCRAGRRRSSRPCPPRAA